MSFRQSIFMYPSIMEEHFLRADYRSIRLVHVMKAFLLPDLRKSLDYGDYDGKYEMFIGNFGYWLSFHFVLSQELRAFWLSDEAPAAPSGLSFGQPFSHNFKEPISWAVFGNGYLPFQRPEGEEMDYPEKYLRPADVVKARDELARFDWDKELEKIKNEIPGFGGEMDSARWLTRRLVDDEAVQSFKRGFDNLSRFYHDAVRRKAFLVFKVV